MGETQVDRTLWVGNLDSRVTEELLYELFLQAGPLAGVKKPSEKNYAFVEFKHDVSVPYSISLMGGLRLFERSMRLQFRSGSKHDSGSSTPNPMSGSSSPVMPGPMGGMMPNGPMGAGMMTPPPLQQSLSVPLNPQMMPRQYNPSMGPPPMGGGGLLGPGPPQSMHSHPGGHMGNRFNQPRMHDDRDGSPAHQSGRSHSHERHRSRDGDRRGSNDLRSYSPPLGQSPDFGRDQRRGSFQGRDESPSGHDFHRRQDDRGGERGRGHHWQGDQEHERGGHQHRSRDREHRGHHDGHHRQRDDRSRSSDRPGRYRDNSRERFNRSGRY